MCCGPTLMAKKTWRRPDFRMFHFRRDEHQSFFLWAFDLYILYRFAIASAAINKFSQLPICTGCFPADEGVHGVCACVCVWRTISTCVYRSSSVPSMAGRNEWDIGESVWLYSHLQNCENCAHDDTRIVHKFTWHVTHFSNISPGEQHPGIRRFVVLAPTTTASATQCQRQMNESEREREKKRCRREKRRTYVQPLKHGNWSENTPASRCGKLITKLINFVCRLRFIRVAKGGARHMLRIVCPKTFLATVLVIFCLLAEIFFIYFLGFRHFCCWGTWNICSISLLPPQNNVIWPLTAAISLCAAK